MWYCTLFGNNFPVSSLVTIYNKISGSSNRPTRTLILLIALAIRDESSITHSILSFDRNFYLINFWLMQAAYTS